MKKLILIVVLLFGMVFSLWAIPTGKYCADDGSFVEVTSSYIFLYIGNYSAGSFSILEEKEDGTFTFSDSSGSINKGKWYERNGRIYLVIGGRTLVKCD